jgi:hypothetical protein
MTMHPVLWASPAPLWGRFGTAVGGAAFRAADQARPAILRFASDDFMAQLLALLDADPRRLDTLIARPETWRTPLGETQDLIQRVPLPRQARALARLRRGRLALDPVDSTAATATVTEKGGERPVPLKLYHPAHQRHYLVSANLVCGIAGFPDRAVSTGGREQIGFVMRRLLVPNANAAQEEFAFVKDASGSRWQRLPSPNGQSADPFAQLGPGEELLPLFPLNFNDDVDHPRRLLAGIIPVGRREEYLSTFAAKQTASSTETGTGESGPKTRISERKEQFRGEVAEPWKNLIYTAFMAASRLNQNTLSDLPDSPSAPAEKLNNFARATNAQIQGQSWLVLLDFADYLMAHAPSVLTASSRNDLATEGKKRLFDCLEKTKSQGGWLFPPGAPPLPATATNYAPNLRAALNKVLEAREGLEHAEYSFPDAPYDGGSWPSFLFPLAGIRLGTDGSRKPDSIHLVFDSGAVVDGDDDAEPTSPAFPASLSGAGTLTAQLDTLVQLVIGAIDPSDTGPTPPLPFAVQLRAALDSTKDDDGWFVIRCAYVRCDCGPVRPTVLSAPSQQFQLASFFDSDAPARPIRIPLPIDTTPAGMRKFNKNTAFMISDVLCGQIQRAKGLGLIDLVMSVLPWPLHKDLDLSGTGACQRNGNSIGMICSLSIPIITICALILLMIIVSLLDLIFRWIPWFIICFPISIPGLKAKR